MATTADLYVSRNNLIEIMKSRGFNVEEYAFFSMEQVASLASDNQLDLLLYNDKDDKRIFIKYSEGRLDVHTLVDKLFKPTINDDHETVPPILRTSDDLFIVTPEEALNESLTETLNLLWERSKLYVSVCSVARLKFNVLKHKLVPKYRILNQKESDALLDKYCASLAQLPEISRYDPPAVALGLRPGQIVYATRPSTTAKDEDFYRVCIQ
jgi:DNA-directed RNA polymerase subunit H (RpoH/RPB5)